MTSYKFSEHNFTETRAADDTPSPDERDVKECATCQARAVYYNPLNEAVQCHACGVLGERRTVAKSRRADDILVLTSFDEMCSVVDGLGAINAKLKLSNNRRLTLLFNLVAAVSEHPELREHPDFKAAQKYVREWAAKEVGE